MELDWYCPMCGEREELHTQCACTLDWNLRRREFPHYAIQTTVDHAEKIRDKKARNFRRVAWVVPDKGKFGRRFVLVLPNPPGHEDGPINLTRAFDTEELLEAFAAEKNIVLLDRSKKEGQMPEVFYKFVFFR